MAGEGFNERAEHEISVEKQTLFSLLESTFQVQGFRVANPIHKRELRQPWHDIMTLESFPYEKIYSTYILNLLRTCRFMFICNDKKEISSWQNCISETGHASSNRGEV